MSGEDSKKSFWTTLPGILTGIAAVLTAIGGLIVAYHSITSAPVGPAENPSPAVENMPTIEIFYSNPATIKEGDTAQLLWNTSYASSITIDPQGGKLAPSGTLAVSPAETTSYKLTAQNKAGKAQEIAQVVVVPREIVIDYFMFDPPSIKAGESATLRWSISNAERAFIDNEVGVVDLTGTRSVTPVQTTAYTLTAEKKASRLQKIAIINVEPHSDAIQQGPIIDYFKVSPSSIQAGESAQLSWSTSNAEKVSIDNEIGDVDIAGTRSVQPMVTTAYTLTAQNKASSIPKIVIVDVKPKSPSVAYFKVSPSRIQAGESAQLSWSTSNAERASIDNEIGAVDLTGTKSASPNRTTVYTLTAFGEAEYDSMSIVLEVGGDQIVLPKVKYYPDKIILPDDLIRKNVIESIEKSGPLPQ